MRMSSHVFVIHGDLHRVHAHGYFIPADARLRMGRQWRGTLLDPQQEPEWEPQGPGASTRTLVGWERPDRQDGEHPVDAPAVLRPGSAGDSLSIVNPPEGTHPADAPPDLRDRLFVVTDIFVPDAEATDHLLSGIDQALDEVAARWRGRPALNRERPLLAMPLVGTGRGGFHKRQGLVVQAILRLLHERIPTLPYDIVLVCYSRAQYAAVQRTREKQQLCLPALPRPLAQAAAHLGELAESNSLGVLFGAGVSIPLGLPSWNQLLRTLAVGTAAGGMEDLRDLDPMDAASLVISALDEEAEPAEPSHGGEPTVPDEEHDVFLERIRGMVRLQRHSLGHGLLASIRPVVAVTTNYDQGYELALRHVVGEDDLAVLPWHQPSSAAAPRVLKIHGDVDNGSVVLSREDFVMMHAIRRPLTALLQEQMLTAHVLAVATSFTDSTLISAIAEASTMLRSIDRERALGTLLMNQRRPARAALIRGSMRVLEADGPPWEEIGPWSPQGSTDPAGPAPVDHGDDAQPAGWPGPGDARLGAEESGRVTDLFLDCVALHASSKVNYLADRRFADLIAGERGLLEVAQQARVLRRAVDRASQSPNDPRWVQIAAALDDLGATSPAPDS